MEETAGHPYWTTGSAFDRLKCAAQELDKNVMHKNWTKMCCTRIGHKCAAQELDNNVMHKNWTKMCCTRIGQKCAVQELDKNMTH